MKKKICMILVAVFVAVLGTSTYFIIDHHKESNKQAALYGELAELVDAAAQTDAATEPAEQIPYSEEKMLLPELAELYQQNGDLVGWISIADTNINYPVMQSVNEPNFYLKHGFDKEYSDYGCPYVQEDCDVQEPSDNLVIYGHHMPTKSPMLIAKAAFALFEKRYNWRNPIRSVTIQAINLVPQDTPRQVDLFMNIEKIEKAEKLDQCIETIRQRFGKDSIRNGILFQNLRMPCEKPEITMPTGMLC